MSAERKIPSALEMATAANYVAKRIAGLLATEGEGGVIRLKWYWGHLIVSELFAYPDLKKEAHNLWEIAERSARKSYDDAKASVRRRNAEANRYRRAGA